MPTASLLSFPTAQELATSNGAPNPNLVIEVRDLTFAFPKRAPALTDVTLEVERGQRIIMVGANGAGKSTLLQLLAGKRLTHANILVLGKDVFNKSSAGVTFLGTEWASNPHVRSDIVVANFLDSVGGWRHKARRDTLLNLLDVDLNWHMHAISDGERRRVQLCMGLMAPWDVLLLDEVTVDLDVLVRHHLLQFLRKESEERGATILYATHIFDGLQTFPTHILHLHLGKMQTPVPIPWPIPADHPGLPVSLRGRESFGLWDLSLAWLEEDRAKRLADEKEDSRGAPVSVDDTPTDSETFYRKYDYSH